MIQIPALAFSYGFRRGITKFFEEISWSGPRSEEPWSVIVFLALPNIPTLKRIANTPGIEFCIIPPCSSYSHLAATIWSTDVPIISIQNPEKVTNGSSVLADFDSETFFLAETEYDAEQLRNWTDQGTKIFQTHAPNFPNRDLSAFKILAEVTSSNGVDRALTDGADGLSVVNADQLFNDRGPNSDTENLVQMVKANHQLLPLLVRFFDLDGDIYHSPLEYSLPQKYLGYRGVRLAEVDDAWLRRFLSGLKALDIDQIMVILPMVTSASEVRRMREQLGREWNQIGITVETPAAALKIQELLDVSDFVEIGLNDLTQYTMAWDRDVPNEERLPADRIVEPVADLIALVVSACTSAGVPYALGMDLRPSERLATQILKLGVRSLSCAPSLIKPWRRFIAGANG